MAQIEQAAPRFAAYAFLLQYLLGNGGLSVQHITALLDRAEEEILVARQVETKKNVLRGRTQINIYFETIKCTWFS